MTTPKNTAEERTLGAVEALLEGLAEIRAEAVGLSEHADTGWVVDRIDRIVAEHAASARAPARRTLTPEQIQARAAEIVRRYAPNLVRPELPQNDT